MENEQSNQTEVKERNPITSVVVGAVGVFCAVYLLNFTAGGVIPFEIPDVIPGLGNLDEAAAATLLISSLAYFGIDVGGIFGRFAKKAKPASNGPKETRGEVIED
ncbi:MAG: hypothetical protein AAF226_04640 [Verrucomicrobiota bacterium]